MYADMAADKEDDMNNRINEFYQEIKQDGNKNPIKIIKDGQEIETDNYCLIMFERHDNGNGTYCTGSNCCTSGDRVNVMKAAALLTHLGNGIHKQLTFEEHMDFSQWYASFIRNGGMK